MEKTEEQVERERLAVDAMRNAKANMTSALGRIATLESELKAAALSTTRLGEYISPSVYPYGNDKTSCQNTAKEAVARIAKVVGS